MQKTFLIMRIFFFALCLAGSGLMLYVSPDMNAWIVMMVGAGIGALVILTDIYIKGFSLSGFTALTFGLAIGALFSYLISSSPLFEPLEDGPLSETIFLVRLVLTIVMMYLGAVIALRGRDEFYLVIPYVRFSPKFQDFQPTIIDTSILIDGRIVGICKGKWLTHGLIIPSFVLQELQTIADASEPKRRERGRRGLRHLNELRALQLDLRIHEVILDEKEDLEDKLILLATSMRARLLTTDYNLAQMAQFRGVEWLNLNELSQALHPQIELGSFVQIDLVREGKEPGQAIGYLRDGSMVVVNHARNYVGQSVEVEISSVIPSAGGKMIFAEIHQAPPGPLNPAI
jgi:uncharacterized protein YacL